MLKESAIQYFDGASKVAQALEISDAAVSVWPEVVPLESATALEILTNGALRVDPKLYPRLRAAQKAVARRTGR